MKKTQIKTVLLYMTKWFSARSKKGHLVRKLSRLKRTSAVMQLLAMFTSATSKDFRISL